MNQILFLIGTTPISLYQVAGAAIALIVTLLLLMLIGASRAKTQRLIEAAAARERQLELDDKMAGIAKANSELTGRIASFAEMLGSRQVELAKHVGERLDHVQQRVGQSIENSARATGDNLQKLNERMAVIDVAQARMIGLTQEMMTLKDILSNKQTRGAFGQGRMEAIVRDGLPHGAFEFQSTLSNGNRPDCVIRLPTDDRALVIDAKFPLEAFSALKDARSDEERRAAGARVRADLGKHVKDIAERYFLPGETQDLAIMFVPSESIYADLNEHFEDVVQKAYKARIIIVSPSLLMLAIQVMQSILRDAQMREQAHIIQKEVRIMLEDVARLRDRVGKLETHFRQAQEDVTLITTSADKIGKRGERIEALEFEDAPAPVATILAGAKAAE